MILYRIQNKETKKFITGIRPWDGKIAYTASGAFFKRIDTIMQYLDYLKGEYVAREDCGFPKWTAFIQEGSKPYHYRNRSFSCADRKVCWNRTYPARLKKFVIVINDVSIKGQRKISAERFLK